jgi:hypothetical protein
VKIFGLKRTEKDEPWSAHTTDYNFLDRVTETHNRGVIAVGGSLDDAIRAHGLDTRALRWLEHDGQTTRVRREDVVGRQEKSVGIKRGHGTNGPIMDAKMCNALAGEEFCNIGLNTGE